MAQAKADKQIVQAGCDSIAAMHHEWTKDKQPHRLRYANDLISRLPLNATVLDLGCGAGIPVLEKLVQHASKVIANDISAAQIAMAKKHCPQAEFVHGDMTNLDFEPDTFDGVAAFFSIFHLPRAEHPAILTRVHKWMKEGAFFAFNLATMDLSEIRGDFLGAEMFWSSYSIEKSKEMVQNAGFELIKAEVLDTGEDVEPGDPDYGIKFLWVLAKKP